MTTLKTTFYTWLPLAIVTTIVCGLVYLAVQQDLRMTANDELVQISEDVSSLLASGAPVGAILPPSNPIDISKSLAVYVIVYDTTGKPVASTAQLNGAVPVPPPGVFSSAQARGEDRLTWQPAPGVRSAIVVHSFTVSASSSQSTSAAFGASAAGSPTSGYVLAGRSLREIEAHESHVEAEAAGAWILALALSFAAVYLSKNH